MSVVIAITYKCRCMAKERDVVIDARHAGEPLEGLMRRIQTAIAFDHFLTSPTCREVKMEYAKIPVYDGIPGGPPTKAPGKPDILF